MITRPGNRTSTQVLALNGTQRKVRADTLAAEEPMEIRLLAGGERHTVAVTMRTPGHDFELAVGFLSGEGVIAHRDEVARISYCVDPEIDADQQYNIVNVALRSAAIPDLAPLERHFTISSACGICGKASLDAIALRDTPELPLDGPLVRPSVLYGLPETLRQRQGIFDKTGGLHAAGLFRPDGELLAAREDVGRHNAVDKLIGWALLEGRLPLGDCILMVSGRTSFEILQKAVAAGIPIVASVSAPSSLAVDTARRFGITLVGFLRDERCNVYTGWERVMADPEPTQ